MKNYRVVFSMLVIWGMVLSCNMPFASPASPSSEVAPSEVTDTPVSPSAPADTSSPTSAEASPPTPTFTPITIVITATFQPTETPCVPKVVAPTPVNVRSGPGTIYEIIGGLSQGQSANIAGKSSDGTWWYIELPNSPNYHGWVGGTVVNASCVPASLAVIAAPPTPTFTPTKVPAIFAVTSVNYAVSKWSDAGHTDCPRITATITVNGPGSVTYSWTRSDGASSPSGTLTFDAAGSKSVSADWALGSVWAPAPAEWMGIYIDDPNHQDFGHANMPACTAP